MRIAIISSSVQDRFDGNGTLTDQAFGEKFDTFLNKLIWFSEAIAEKKATGRPEHKVGIRK